jgi:hypothetical protein
MRRLRTLPDLGAFCAGDLPARSGAGAGGVFLDGAVNLPVARQSSYWALATPAGRHLAVCCAALPWCRSVW